jgi:hypothetical protein
MRHAWVKRVSGRPIQCPRCKTINWNNKPGTERLVRESEDEEQVPKVEVDEKLYARLELEALRQEASVDEVAARAIQMYLAAKESKALRSLGPRI